MSERPVYDASGVVFVNPKGEVLLQLRDDIPTIRFPNHWGIIGGGVEEGESIEQALRREAMEEINEELGEVYYWGVYKSIPMRPLADLNLHIYVAALDKPAESLALTEGQCVRWHRPEDALELDLIPSVRTMLTEFVGSELHRRLQGT